MSDSPPNTITLTVPGMGSDHCAGIVRKTLERLDGVGEIQTNIANHHVSVTIEAGGPDGDTLKEAVEGAGYDVAAVSGGTGMQQVRLTVPGMGSDHCTAPVEGSPGGLQVKPSGSRILRLASRPGSTRASPRAGWGSSPAYSGSISTRSPMSGPAVQRFGVPDHADSREDCTCRV